MGKTHRLPSHSSTSVYSPLELIFTDLWGPSHVTSYAGYTYYVFFIDAFSRYRCCQMAMPWWFGVAEI